MAAGKTTGEKASRVEESDLFSDYVGGAVERDEHVGDVLAFRRLSSLGVVAWALFGVTDLFIVLFVQPGRLWFYLVLRAVGLVVLGLVGLRLRLEPMPSPRLVRVMDIGTFAVISMLISGMCVEFRGISSPLALGVITVMVCRSALMSDRWQRGLLPTGITAATHPISLLTLSLFVPSMAEQLRDPVEVGGFVLNQMFIFGAAALALVGNHRMWALRRKVYEARSLGRYRLKTKIGRGGMGEVWIAHHNTLNREVAVKILRPDKMDKEAILRFQREVKATSELSHPNTVRVFDYGVTEDGLCYYAMELLKGHDLATLVKQEGPLAPRRAACLMVQVAKALSEAHERGIIHRDLKPGNLILTHAGCEQDLVKVVDFGLALVTTSELEKAVTHTGFIVGTPAYIAPELLTGIPADERADLFALGAVMYELLCGSPPFAAKDAKLTLLERTRNEAVPPSKILGHPLPQDIEAITMKLLRRDPAERLQTAKELVKALVDFIGAPSDMLPMLNSSSPMIDGNSVDDADDDDEMATIRYEGRAEPTEAQNSLVRRRADLSMGGEKTMPSKAPSSVFRDATHEGVDVDEVEEDTIIDRR